MISLNKMCIDTLNVTFLWCYTLQQSSTGVKGFHLTLFLRKKKKSLNLESRIMPMARGFSGGQTVMNILQILHFIRSQILIIYLFREHLIMLAGSLDEKV